MNAAMDNLYESILEGDMASAPGAVHAALDNNIAPDTILNECPGDASQAASLAKSFVQ